MLSFTPKDGQWHRCPIFWPLWPVRLENGRFAAYGKLWRCWDGRKWKYRQDEETAEEFYDRNW